MTDSTARDDGDAVATDSAPVEHVSADVAPELFEPTDPPTTG